MHSGQSNTISRLNLFWVVLLGATLGLLVDLTLHSIFFFAWQRQDQTWILYAAARVLDGVPLYGQQLVELNPPLIIWLSTLPAWLAIHLHLQPLLVLHSLVTLLLLLSSAWSIRILRFSGVLQTRVATITSFVLLLAAQTFVRDVDFAEREHIIVLLLFPFLLASFFSLSSRLHLAERLALGLAAGLACCIKPQYVLILLGTELVLALWYRQLPRLWRPELLALLGTAPLYLVAVLRFAPLYFSQIIPDLRDCYPAYHGAHSTTWVMFHGFGYDSFFVVVLLVWFLLRRSLRYPVPPAMLLLASFCATVSFGIQHTGWPYQTIPRTALLLAAAFWLAAELTTRAVRLRESSQLRVLYGVMLLVVLLPSSVFAFKRIVHGRNFGPLSIEQKVYTKLPPGTTVYVLSTNFYNFSDVVQYKLRWGGRYVHLWTLPAIVQNETAEAGGPAAPFPLTHVRVEQLATTLRSNVAADLHTYAPSVVFVENCDPANQCLGLENMSFDTLAWFQRSPAFAAEWRNYHLQETSAAFNLYVRDTPASP